jgi:hypothetical protein
MDRYLRTALARNIEKWAPPKGTSMRSEFFFALNVHPSLTLEVLELYHDDPWKPDQLVKNPNFDWSWVERFQKWPWNWRKLSRCSPSIDVILRHLDKPWDWYVLTTETGPTFYDMVMYPNLPWQIEHLLFQLISDDTDIEFLRMFKDRYDDIAWIDHSKRVTWDIVKKTPDLPWRYDMIIPEIKTLDDLQFLENIYTNVDWMKLSRTVDVNLILSYQSLPWLWGIVSINPTLTIHHVRAHPEIPWRYSAVPVEELDAVLIRKWEAATIIQRMWRRAISDPSYMACKKRLLEEYDECNI